MSRTLLTIVLFGLCGLGGALAQARPSTQALTCQAAQALVQKSGAIVLDTGAGTYDRYVSGQQFCIYGQITQPAYVSTRDVRDCVVGFVCEGRNRRGAN
ncbi:hypothetical protein MCEMSEM23_02900 [Rhabdaerophilaceae bacterium]